MNNKTFTRLLLLFALLFSLFFFFVVIPAFIDDWNIIAAFAGGFVNPFAAGYSTDVIFCWLILAVWVLYERQMGVKYGWICLVLGIVPGVAVGFALYLLIRNTQIQRLALNNEA